MDVYYRAVFCSKLNSLCLHPLTIDFFGAHIHDEVIGDEEGISTIFYTFKFLFWKRLVGFVEVKNLIALEYTNRRWAIFWRYCLAYKEENGYCWIKHNYNARKEEVITEEDIVLYELEKKYMR